MEEKINNLLNILLDKASQGDLPAAKLAIDYYSLYTQKKPSYSLPKCKTSSDIVEAYGAIIEMLGDGKLTIDEAHRMGSLLNMQVRAIEVHEQEEEIIKLNERFQK